MDHSANTRLGQSAFSWSEESSDLRGSMQRRLSILGLPSDAIEELWTEEAQDRRLDGLRIFRSSQLKDIEVLLLRKEELLRMEVFRSRVPLRLRRGLSA